MKKVLKLLLAVFMVVSFTACSGGNSTDEQKHLAELFNFYYSGNVK